MKVLVIGLGSMGKRRARLIRSLYPFCEVYGVDAREDRREEASLMHVKAFESVDAALAAAPDIGCAFISTSPLSHAELIHECLLRSLHVFTEINLAPDGYDENIELARKQEKVLFLSSTPIYREEMQYIKREVEAYAKPVKYIYHVGQYLPDWHPWEKYNDFFVGDRRTGGCREIFAIELPWMTQAFGQIKSVYSVHDKNSGLRIDYDDNYQVVITHKNGSQGVFCVDVISPKAVRGLEVYAENLYLSWDGTPEGLQTFSSGKMNRVSLYDVAEHQDGYQKTIVENAYANEIKAFFEAVGGDNRPRYGFENDKVVLSVIDRIEGSRYD